MLALAGSPPPEEQSHIFGYVQKMASMRVVLCLLGFILFIGSASSEGNFNETPGNSTEEDDRSGKFISLFTVVRFSNSMCTASSGYNGTCLTSAECSAAGGTGTGSCASGFGVCCVFTYTTCGTTSSRNCSYWQNPGGASTTYNQIAQCNFIVKKCSSNICQIRLDFYSFTLNQPDINGVCSVDMFTVSSGASNPVPIICGDNTGQHMYLDMSPNTDSFQLSVITTTANMSRSWNIKATQIPCTDYSSLAPDQCLQYYQTASGTIQSFNYKSTSISSTTQTRQLANQDYAICIRMNAGFCGICYTACTDSLNSPYSAAFSVSGAQLASGTANPTLVDSSCTTDWLMIPCANNQRVTTPTQATSPATTPTTCVSRICGGVFSSYATTGASPGTAAASPVPVYSYRKPFVLNYYTDSLETSNSDSNNLGFCLTYVQQPCTSTQSG